MTLELLRGRWASRFLVARLFDSIGSWRVAWLGRRRDDLGLLNREAFRSDLVARPRDGSLNLRAELIPLRVELLDLVASCSERVIIPGEHGFAERVDTRTALRFERAQPMSKEHDVATGPCPRLGGGGGVPGAVAQVGHCLRTAPATVLGAEERHPRDQNHQQYERETPGPEQEQDDGCGDEARGHRGPSRCQLGENTRGAAEDVQRLARRMRVVAVTQL